MHSVFDRYAMNAARFLSFQRGTVQLPLGGAFFRGGEIYQAIFFINTLDGASTECIDIPIAGRELTNYTAVVIVKIQMLMAVAAAGPDEFARILQECQLVIKIDPRPAGFGQDEPGLSGGRVGEQQIQGPLIAALALNRQRFAVRQPVYPREVDVLLTTSVD